MERNIAAVAKVNANMLLPFAKPKNRQKLLRNMKPSTTLTKR